MAKVKRENHHWWPEVLSRQWANDEGFVTRLSPDGTARRSVPKNFGNIGGGHIIRSGGDDDEIYWHDVSFERVFDRPDNNFHLLIEWISNLDHCVVPARGAVEERLLVQKIDDVMFDVFFECLASLVVRSPLYRHRAIALAEQIRGAIQNPERDILIGENIKSALPCLVRVVGRYGRFLVLYSPEREFLFGDGMFNNIPVPVEHVHDLKMLCCLTPWIAVVFFKPLVLSGCENLLTLVLRPDETESINFSVQVYSKNEIFYRSERPIITSAFSCGEHRKFARSDNFVDTLISIVDRNAGPARKA